jgi:hypothetical protein
MTGFNSKRDAAADKLQEPFGYFKAEPFGWTDCAETDKGARALYEAPPKREWVGLTNEEYDQIWRQDLNNKDLMDLTIAKLKEKNNGT